MRKKTLVFDFDGVIHSGYVGWKDGSIYGEIDMELLDIMKNLLEYYTIAISSTRSANQIVDHMNKLDCGITFELMENKVPAFWNKEGVIGVSNMKVGGVMYVDDRGFRFKSLDQFKKECMCANDDYVEIWEDEACEWFSQDEVDTKLMADANVLGLNDVVNLFTDTMKRAT